jgi:hypothetical protein
MWLESRFVSKNSFEDDGRELRGGRCREMSRGRTGGAVNTGGELERSSPMQEPRTRIIRPEPNGDVAAEVSSIDDVTADRVSIVVVGIGPCALDDEETMLLQ